MPSRRSSGFLLILIALMWPGCGGGVDKEANRPKRAPAAGTVFYKEQPLDGATVIFLPQGHNDAAVGKTDASGRFTLQTFDPGDGAVPGEYKVTVVKLETTAAAPRSDDEPVSEEAEPKSLIPVKYGKPDTSGLTASIPDSGDSNLTFKLED